MPKALTAISVERAKAVSARKEYPDGLLTGFYLVIQPSGAKSWAVRYRHAGTPRKMTLGPYPVLNLGQAREEARAALRAVARGDDPAALKRAKRRALSEGVDHDLFKNVVTEFMARHMEDKRSRHEVERMFNKSVLPFWGERRIQEITRRDVIELLDGLTDRGVGTMTNRVFSIIRKLFNWAITRDVVSVSPCAGIRAPLPEVSRDRVLSDDEIRWFWAASSEIGFPFGPLFKLLLVTGQRLSEVGELKAGELRLGDRLWTIPKERVKNNSAHEVRLSEVALEILNALPRVEGRGFVFTTTGETPVSGFSRAKSNLDKAMLALAQAEAGAEASIPEWRLHDLRRTAASGMARLGQPVHVVEAVLNHKSGTIRGVAAVYNRYSYAEEKRRALEAWGSFLEHLTRQPDGGQLLHTSTASTGASFDDAVSGFFAKSGA